MAKTKKKTKSNSDNTSQPTPIPQDFPAISAHLVVGDVKKAIDFYRKTFGFDLMGEPMTMGKAIIHAVMTYRDQAIMLGPAMPPESHATPKDQGIEKQGFGLFVYVQDVDAHYKRVKRFKGLLIPKPPETMFWGDRVYDVVDRDGHRWSFASRVEDKTPEQMKEELSQMMAAQG